MNVKDRLSARWLSGLGYEVYSVFDDSPGMTDEDVLSKAYGEGWILITNDRDSEN